MSSSVLHPPAHLSPEVALHVSQQAPSILNNTPAVIQPYTLQSLWNAAESPELWSTYENLMLSCLRTGDEDSARLCLGRLTERFGTSNERVLALVGLYDEATAKTEAELNGVLTSYERILKNDPTNTPVAKRRIALLRSIKRLPEAVTALNSFLDASPTDAEAWAELADIYLSQGLFQQSIFALEEVLLIAPNAWNIQARLGEVLYMAASGDPSLAERYLIESFRRFCRSIELCDDYLRGYYGLKLTTGRLLNTLKQNSKAVKSDGSLQTPDFKAVEKLNELATAKLSEIVRKKTSREVGWEGYDDAEIIAAKELIDRETVSITR